MTYRQNYSDLQIAEAYIQGGSLSKGAVVLGVPKSTFRNWLKEPMVDPEIYSRPETWEGWDINSPSKIADEFTGAFSSPEFDPNDSSLARSTWGIGIPELFMRDQRETTAYLRRAIDDLTIQPKRTVLERYGDELMESFSNIDLEEDIPEHENSCILVIPDLHCPYQHKDTLAFLKAVKLEYYITRVICLGDELDSHAMSFHTSDPDLDSAGTELGRAREFLSELEILFPKLDLLHSNHGSMLYRRGKEHGIPKHMLKSYNDVLGVSEGWQWHEDLTLELPNGQLVHFHHGRSADPLKVAQSLGMSYVAGHYHTQFNIQYFSTPIALNWAMQSGCLIDDHSLAFAYNKLSVGRPILGCSLIIDSQPKLVPMLLDRQGNWLGASSLC